MNIYDTYEWRYSAKRGLTMVIYARNRKTADEIIEIENAENVYYFKPARFFFRKPTKVIVPPYDLELHQLETAQNHLQHRRKYFIEHPQEAPKILKKSAETILKARKTSRSFVENTSIVIREQGIQRQISLLKQNKKE